MCGPRASFPAMHSDNTMTDKIRSRLNQLREEQKKGQQMLADAEREADELRAALLRIVGAIQVLEELENDSEQGSASDTD